MKDSFRNLLFSTVLFILVPAFPATGENGAAPVSGSEGQAESAAPPPPESRGPRLDRVLEVPVPPDLLGLMMEDPQARYRVQVDARGQVKEAFCLEATHYRLVDVGLKRVLKTEFEPALQLGIPISMGAIVTVRFFDPEQEIWRSGVDYRPFGSNASTAVERRMYNVNKESYVYAESAVDELDDLLVLLEGKIIVVSDEAGNKAKGKCKIEFYIGPDGKVYFPRIVESEDDLVSMSAITTLQGFQFKPPTVDGRPTYVRVRQAFSFTE